nr:HDIG domain-containing protein [Anaerolineae bacterium]
ALASAEVSVIGVLGLATLVGLMQNNSLEMAMLVGVGGLLATLTVRRPERLNGYFMPGLLVGLANVAVVLIFFQGDLTSTSNTVGIGTLILYSLVNGVLSATIALAGIYIATLLFNIPTGLKLVELSQPNQPLLQRLLREAPGTYQHSLQVSNMSEQAANAIGMNADLVRVAALYHDVGKMINPAFFTENQIEGINPHDALDDPARSAAIIISHVTEGDKIARQYRLPARLRDFILEHHGTQVLYFYQQAVQRAGSDQGIDVEQFTYPGPKPQTKETAILMLADSSEATVRSRKPTKKQEIDEIVHHIIDGKIQSGQLDESGLTLNDLNIIRRIFVDMLQAVFHPRINYPPQLKSTTESSTEIPRVPSLPNVTQEVAGPRMLPDGDLVPTIVVATEPEPVDTPRPSVQTKEMPAIKIVLDTEDEAPLPDVPPLPRTGEYKTVRTAENGKTPLKKDTPEE